MRLIDILTTATANMFRSKVRTGITITAIFIGAFTIALTIGISSGVSAYIDKQLGNVGAENVLLIRTKVDFNLNGGPKKYDPNKKNTTQSLQSIMLNNKDIKKIKTQKGLKNVQPIIMAAPEYIFGNNKDKYQLSAQSFIDGSNFDLITGKLPDNSASQPEILLPVSYVEPLGFASAADAVGKTVTLAIKTPLGQLEDVTAIVCGVQQQTLLTEGAVSTNKSLITRLLDIQTKGLPIDTAESYFAVSGEVATGISSADLQTIKDGLSAKGYVARTVADQIGIVKNVIDAITSVLVFFGAIALLAASFGIVNTLFMSVQERTREIGLMKAMGMGSSRIFLLFSFEAILIGFWGSIIGTLVAIGTGQVVNKIASENFLKDLPGFNLTEFPLPSVLVIMLAIMFIAFLAGTLPSRRAARQDPIEALRYE